MNMIKLLNINHLFQVYGFKNKSAHISFACLAIIRIIPQGTTTVDNNLGPYRLAGTKALDPNYCRQPTL